MYKPNIIHVVANTLSRLPNVIEPTSVPNQTTNASLFYIGPKWMNDGKELLKIRQLKGTLLVQKKQRLVEPFTLKNGELYKMGQDNILQ